MAVAGTESTVAGAELTLTAIDTEFEALLAEIVAVVPPELEPDVKVNWQELFGAKAEGQLFDVEIPRVGEAIVVWRLFAFALPILVTVTLCDEPPKGKLTVVGVAMSCACCVGHVTACMLKKVELVFVPLTSTLEIKKAIDVLVKKLILQLCPGCKKAGQLLFCTT